MLQLPQVAIGAGVGQTHCRGLASDPPDQAGGHRFPRRLSCQDQIAPRGETQEAGGQTTDKRDAKQWAQRQGAYGAANLNLIEHVATRRAAQRAGNHVDGVSPACPAPGQLQ